MRSLEISSAAAANAVMMAAGYFNPLTGFMNKEEAIKVSKEMLTPLMYFGQCHKHNQRC